MDRADEGTLGRHHWELVLSKVARLGPRQFLNLPRDFGSNMCTPAFAMEVVQISVEARTMVQVGYSASLGTPMVYEHSGHSSILAI